MARKSPTSSYTEEQPTNLKGQADNSVDDLLTQKQASWDAMRPVIADWADRERLLINRAADSQSQKTTRSHVTDGGLSTLAFERQARVAAQLPTGTIYSINAKDDKAAGLMNLVLNKYILPNANSQMDALTKLRMSGVYASVYGAQPILYDYRVDDEYIGPDFWLIPPRNFFPQPGKNNIRDCDWVMVSTIVSISYLESIAKRKNTSWNKANLNELIKAAKAGTVPERDLDSAKKSEVEDIRTFGRPFGETGSSARVELVTKYEKGKSGRWITFAPDFKDCGKLRDIPNPHKSGRIPIVMRQCFPLVDSIWGLGDFERGITLQKAKDSLINLYLDGVKLSIFPPLLIDPTNVTMPSLRMEAGARWLVKDVNAGVKSFENNPQALNNFQGTYQFLSSTLQNQFGTLDPNNILKQDSGNSAFGRTPQGIEAQQDREGARDNWDRFQLEKCIEDLIEGMINLLSENQEQPIDFHIFDADVEQITQQFGDEDDNVPNWINVMGRSAKVSVAKSLIKGEYRFIVDASSTLKQSEEDQVNAAMQRFQLYLTNPQAIDQLLQQDGYKYNFGKDFQQYIYNSGSNDPDSIISKLTDEDSMQMQPPQIDPQQLNQLQDPDIRNAAQQLFGQQEPQQMPMQGGMNG